MCARGGYGSVQILPLLDAAAIAATPKVFIGYSDITALHTWLTQRGGLVSFHGPMLEGRFADGAARYDARLVRARGLGQRAAGRARAGRRSRSCAAGEASGVLVGGTLTQLAASLGTPFAFDPPPGTCCSSTR